MGKDIIKFAKLDPNAIIPSFGREGDGCMDVYACFEDDEFIIMPHAVALIPTGICSTFDSKYRISIRERGSNTKSTLLVMAGQIDSNYTGEWFIALYNGNDKEVRICKSVDMVEKDADAIRVPYNKAIAQCAVEYVPLVESLEVCESEITSLKTNRGNGKLGSSGK